MIIFTKHSLLKLKQRNIPKNFVDKTVENPDYVASSRNYRRIAYKKFSKLYLKVIYFEKNNNIIIITQYWNKKINY